MTTPEPAPIEPFPKVGGPPAVWPLMFAVAALQLASLVWQAYDDYRGPVALRVAAGVVQYFLILFTPLCAGIWWGRGRPRARKRT